MNTAIMNAAMTNPANMNTARFSILIVDDQPDNLRTLAAILDRQGYKVRKAVSGAMALKTVRADPPNLILLDIRMPQMDGYQVCEALKATAETQSIPVIFLSALSETTDKVKAFSIGGADYITKPFQAEEVLVRIGHQLVIQEQQRLLQQEIQERCNAEANVRQLNSNLEQLVEERTAQLRRSLEFEALLKRITDKVRDSLDEDQILQAAVQELTHGLGLEYCGTEIYDAEFTYSTITHESNRCPFSFLEHVEPMNSSGLYHQLLQKQGMQFCEYPVAQADFQQQTILVCPIFDDHGLLGNLRVVKPIGTIFDDLEVRVVGQIANQCAIAIRQARLYQEAQQQVQELKRLDQLKDDFLSTISHELRSPIANIKMVVRLIMAMSNQAQDMFSNLDTLTSQNSKIYQYFQILQDECERELSLIQDLLDLQHLNANAYPLDLSTLNLSQWILHILEPFERMIQNQQQVLEVNLAPDLPAFLTDESSLKRILTELLNNAYKYTPPHGKIVLAIRVIQEQDTGQRTDMSLDFPPSSSSRVSASRSSVTPPKLTHALTRLQINITNTGVEIPIEEYSRIFDAFYRIPSNDPWKHGGTGLGLALIRRIVEYLSGSIEVTSGAGQTCFTVEFPIDVEPPTDVEPPIDVETPDQP
ncbi:MAG TPA: response regulator [Allocoleopsis sp.]